LTRCKGRQENVRPEAGHAGKQSKHGNQILPLISEKTKDRKKPARDRKKTNKSRTQQKPKPGSKTGQSTRKTGKKLGRVKDPPSGKPKTNLEAWKKQKTEKTYKKRGTLLPSFFDYD
jgi:hypothetical protein